MATQTKRGFSTSPSTTIAATFDASCTAGSLLVAVVDGNANNTHTITDSAGQTWGAADRSGSGSTAGKVSIFSLVNASATALTITCTFGGSTSNRVIQIYEVPSITSAVTDAVPAAQTGASAPSITFSPQSGSFVVAAIDKYGQQAGKVDAGYTLDCDAITIGYYFSCEHKDSAAGGSETLTYNSATNDAADLSFCVASYKSAGGGGSSDTVPLYSKHNLLGSNSYGLKI